MECLITFLVLLVLMIAGTGSAARVQSRSSQRRKTYQQLAKRYSGLYLPGGLFARPAVRFPYGETQVTIREATGRGPFRGKVTQVQLNWPDGRFFLEIFRDGENQLLPYASERQIGIGVEPFDRDYVMSGSDLREVTVFLSEGVRWQLNRLRRLHNDDSLYVRIHRGRLTVQKQQRLWRFGDLEQLIQNTLELYNQAMLTQAVGIEFLNTGLAQPLEDVICKVCGETIQESMVYCRRCKTPHHVDCWKYNGACSVYGCQETRYHAPPTVAPLNNRHPAAGTAPSG